MSGGIAYVLDESGVFAAKRCNRELVDLEEIYDHVEIEEVLNMITRHHSHTGSPVAQRVINQWYQLRLKFVKVMPRDYKRALARLQREEMGTSIE
jgi:glutamate synthase (ferredoxin)